jgi:hypothetical protein
MCDAFGTELEFLLGCRLPAPPGMTGCYRPGSDEEVYVQTCGQGMDWFEKII